MMRETDKIRAGAPSKLGLGGDVRTPTIQHSLKTPAQAELRRGIREKETR